MELKTLIPMCPHCFKSFPDHGALGQHLRDDGDAGTRCEKLRRPK